MASIGKRKKNREVNDIVDTLLGPSAKKKKTKKKRKILEEPVEEPVEPVEPVEPEATLQEEDIHDLYSWDIEDEPKKEEPEPAIVPKKILVPTIPRNKLEAPGKYLAIDCEMVGVGFNGCISALARVSIVNYHGHCLLDSYVTPQEPVTDYRTWVSGIRKSDLKELGQPFQQVQQEVADLLKDRILVGHALKNDLQALMLTHPPLMIRDTAQFGEFKKLNKPDTKAAPSLKTLAQKILGIRIQGGEHSSVEDAKTAMLLYRKAKNQWEKEVAPRRYKQKVKQQKTKERFVKLRREMA